MKQENDMGMSDEVAAAVLRMCVNIQEACPWAKILVVPGSQSGPANRSPLDIFEELAEALRARVGSAE